MHRMIHFFLMRAIGPTTFGKNLWQPKNMPFLHVHLCFRDDEDLPDPSLGGGGQNVIVSMWQRGAISMTLEYSSSRIIGM